MTTGKYNLEDRTAKLGEADDAESPSDFKHKLDLIFNAINNKIKNKGINKNYPNF